MRWQGLAAACAIGLVAATVAATEQDDLKAPWYRGGTVMPADMCRLSRESVGGPGFTRALTIRCADTTSGFVVANQLVSAEAYRGKRVRLSAMLRGESVRGWAGLYLEVENNRVGGAPLAFDNTVRRAPHGTFDWQQASIVLDVPLNAGSIGFGFLQNGDGTSSAGAMALEVVDASVPTTDAPRDDLQKTPDFSLNW